MIDVVVFGVSAIIVLGGALGVVLSKNPVRAALSLVASFLAVAVLFVIQQAHFLALVQVVVYGGAIVVLFLFVIMLLGVDKVEDLDLPERSQVVAGIVSGLAFFGLICAGLFVSGPGGDEGNVALTGQIGRNPIDSTDDINQLAADIFTRNLVPFMATALLLTIATIGAVVMVKNSEADSSLPEAEVN